MDKAEIPVTKKGFEILNQMKKIAAELSNKLLTGVDPSDFEIFQKVLLKIQQNGGAEEETFNCGLNQLK